MISLLSLGTLLAGVSLASARPSARSCSASSPPNSTNSTNGLVAASWYAGWHSEDVPLANVSWDKYTHMTYSFATTSPDVNVLTLADSDLAILPDFVSTAQSHGVKALVSIGGWTGGLYYSSNVADAANRTAFVKTVTTLATNFSLDGIDFDWEYPSNVGVGCNIVSPNDTANFLSFLQELRADPVGSKLFLTAATSVTPWADASGSPATNLTGFSDVLDYIAIMNYDIWGSWSPTAGPNAPLNDTCAAGPQKAGSAVAAVQAWNSAGIPMNQIVLGVPGYGHSFSVATKDALPDGPEGALATFPAFDAKNQPLGDSWDDPNPGPDVCGNPQGAEGDFDFWGLIEGGFLTSNGSVAAGIAYAFDECSQTPFVYNQTSQVYIAYDDASSFSAKGGFIKSTGLRGFAMWETGGDSNDILINSIRSSAGFS